MTDHKTAPDRVIVEADGGSRGNPGPAAYGALVRDGATGEVLAQVGQTLGIATNNVAEYSGLIAGLELADEIAPDASIEVRMDSKLVIEQMAGRWKIRHPDLRPLAIRAQSLAPLGTEWTWVPREQNAAADALANMALDGKPIPPRPSVEVPAAPKEPSSLQLAVQGWGRQSDEPPTRLLLVRHGETPHTVDKRFSGPGGADPGLTDTGRAQARAAASYVGSLGGVDALLSSPMRRTRETAAVIGAELGLEPVVSEGWQECAFGEWDGHTFAEVQRKWPDELNAWLDSTSVAPPGGESFDACARRVRSARDAVLSGYPGKTVVVVTHVTPVKLVVRSVLQSPVGSIFRMELRPGSVTDVHWYADGLASLRGFNLEPRLLL
jgi:ribonuclease H / adenosylcobalamin/alpha-ribazole phosphatase